MVSLSTFFVFINAALAAAITVNTTSGPITGSSINGVTSYLGLPFAAPPFGSLRFRHPLPATFSPHPRNSSLSKACIQFQFQTAFTPTEARALPLSAQSEDCLYLNIWVPDTVKKGSVAALVYIHGGGFAEGSAMSGILDGQNLARKTGLIVASLNYRLNVFGFPSLPQAGQQNLGLLDQRLAIEFLHRNIHLFGGDPKKLTLFGHSAGARSIAVYTFAYPHNPLVHGVIIESGSARLGPPLSTKPASDADFFAIAEKLGCGNNGSDKEFLECMQRLNATEIRKAVSGTVLNSWTAFTGGAPGVDNKTAFDAEEYKRRGSSGQFAQIPTLIGTANYEADTLVPFHENGINYTLSDLVTKDFTCRAAIEAGYRARNGVPVWRYRYMPRLPAVTAYEWMRGAYHFSEVPPLWGNIEKLGIKTPEKWELEMGDYLQKVWGAFAKDPRGGLEKLGWPRYQQKGSTLGEIGTGNIPGVRFVEPRKYDDGCDLNTS